MVRVSQLLSRCIGDRTRMKPGSNAVAKRLVARSPPCARKRQQDISRDQYSKLTQNDNQVFLGYPFEELAALEKYNQSEIVSDAGFHVDWFGINTRYSYFSDIA